MRAIAEAIGRDVLARATREAQAQERRQHQKFLGVVAMACNVFVKEGREVSAEAVAAFLAPVDTRATTDAVAEALAEIAAIESRGAAPEAGITWP